MKNLFPFYFHRFLVAKGNKPTKMAFHEQIFAVSLKIDRKKSVNFLLLDNFKKSNYKSLKNDA